MDSEDSRIYVGNDAETALPVFEPATRALCVQGPAGCGKTSGIVVPAVRDWPGPVIVVSADENLWTDTAAARRTSYGPTMIWDLCNRIAGRETTITMDLLAGCESNGVCGRRVFSFLRALDNQGPMTDAHPAIVDRQKLFGMLCVAFNVARIAGWSPIALGRWAMSLDWQGIEAAALGAGRRDLAQVIREGTTYVSQSDLEWVRLLLGDLSRPDLSGWVSHPGFDLRQFVIERGALYITSAPNLQGLVNCFLDDTLITLESWCDSGWEPDPPLLLVLDPIDGLAFPLQLKTLVTEPLRSGVLPVITSHDTLLWLLSVADESKPDGADFAQYMEALPPAGVDWFDGPRHLVFGAFFAALKADQQPPWLTGRDLTLLDLPGPAFLCKRFTPERELKVPDARSADAASGRLSPDGNWRWDGTQWVPAS